MISMPKNPVIFSCTCRYFWGRREYDGFFSMTNWRSCTVFKKNKKSSEVRLTRNFQVKIVSVFSAALLQCTNDMNRKGREKEIAEDYCKTQSVQALGRGASNLLATCYKLYIQIATNGSATKPWLDAESKAKLDPRYPSQTCETGLSADEREQTVVGRLHANGQNQNTSFAIRSEASIGHASKSATQRTHHVLTMQRG